MTDKQEFLYTLLDLGATATVTSVTGTACSCVGERGASREWHRVNSSSTDCNGTGIINTTTTTISVKAFFTNRLQSLLTILNQFMKSPIGELNEADLFMYGTAKASDATFYDLTNLDRKNDKITFQSKDYIVHHVYDLWTNDQVGQVAMLKRIA